ncbi:hypothetical protein AVEN_54822-1 [Araneus ventricosus]|uniref:Uncharacterized protein n=1 Tax=Araneus ventricosus TaxID=182803 RepID=A0A4Y2EWQ1_ARAVE|nr:hypothetical protein AVEN_54822-1 [Araneus ventricosus]
MIRQDLYSASPTPTVLLQADWLLDILHLSSYTDHSRRQLRCLRASELSGLLFCSHQYLSYSPVEQFNSSRHFTERHALFILSSIGGSPYGGRHSRQPNYEAPISQLLL